jgi:hypothetical protein
MFGIPLPFPSLYLKIAGVLACVAAVSFAAYQVTAAFKDAKYGKLTTAVAQAETVAVQRARHVEVASSQLSTASSTHEATAQAEIAAKGRVIHDKVNVHVPATSHPRACVTLGFLRHLDAAGLGLDPSDVGATAGQPDDACSALSPADAAAAIGDRFTDARANAEQLDALIADVRRRIDIANGKDHNDAVDAPH